MSERESVPVSEPKRAKGWDHDCAECGKPMYYETRDGLPHLMFCISVKCPKGFTRIPVSDVVSEPGAEAMERPVEKLARLLSAAGAIPIISLTPDEWNALLAIKVEAAVLAERERCAKVAEAAALACGDLAERLALDMDASCKDHSRWYRAVKRVRKLLAAPTPKEG